jgi:hypothetical protein
MGFTRTELGTIMYVVGQEIKRKNQGYDINHKYISELETIWDKLNQYRTGGK